MTCPICEGATKVINSRTNSESVRRRRECVDCGYRFSTLELDIDLMESTKPKKEASK